MYFCSNFQRIKGGKLTRDLVEIRKGKFSRMWVTETELKRQKRVIRKSKPKRR